VTGSTFSFSGARMVREGAALYGEVPLRHRSRLTGFGARRQRPKMSNQGLNVLYPSDRSKSFRPDAALSTLASLDSPAGHPLIMTQIASTGLRHQAVERHPFPLSSGWRRPGEEASIRPGWRRPSGGYCRVCRGVDGGGDALPGLPFSNGLHPPLSFFWGDFLRLVTSSCRNRRFSATRRGRGWGGAATVLVPRPGLLQSR